MKPSLYATISVFQMLLGCLIVVILYRKISEKSRGAWSLFAKFAEEIRVTLGVLTLKSLPLYMNAHYAGRQFEKVTISIKSMIYRTVRNVLRIQERRLNRIGVE